MLFHDFQEEFNKKIDSLKRSSDGFRITEESPVPNRTK